MELPKLKAAQYIMLRVLSENPDDGRLHRLLRKAGFGRRFPSYHRHTAALEDAGYVASTIISSPGHGQFQRLYRITETGRREMKLTEEFYNPNNDFHTRIIDTAPPNDEPAVTLRFTVGGVEGEEEDVTGD